MNTENQTPETSNEDNSSTAADVKYVTLTIQLPAHLVEAAEKLCQEQGISLSSAVEQRLWSWISGG